MSYRHNNTDKDAEQVYECQECGTTHTETACAVRPITRCLYCDRCQSEELRLCV